MGLKESFREQMQRFSRKGSGSNVITEKIAEQLRGEAEYGSMFMPEDVRTRTDKQRNKQIK